MGKISSYSTSTPVLTDKLIGTDVGGSPTDSTKNFLLSDIQTLFKSGIALSDVLAAGNTATANIVLTGDITASGTISSGSIVSAPVVKATEIQPIAATYLSIASVPSYPDNNAAKAPTGPLSAGDLYITDGLGGPPLNVAGILMVVV